MQETRNTMTGDIRRELHLAENHERLLALMDADVRPNEVVSSRRELRDEEGKALYVECILRELLAIPAATFERPVFAKLNHYLKNYRKFYGWKDPIPADQLPK